MAFKVYMRFANQLNELDGSYKKTYMRKLTAELNTIRV